MNSAVIARGGRGAQGSRPAKWVWAVVAAYLLLLVGMVGVPWWTLLASDSTWGEFALMSSVTAVWLLAIAGLLLAPVQVGRGRPMTRKSIWMPLLASGFLAGCLAFAAGIAVWELFKLPDVFGPMCIMAGIATWALWSGIFYLMTRRQGATRIGLVLHRWVLAGSVLELLVAVPSHIIVRRRGECCAGMATGTAIGIGAIIALTAFGPSVVLLYVRRWRQLTIMPGERGFEVELSQPQKVVNEKASGSGPLA